MNKKNYTKINQGIKYVPLFNFKLNQIIPCLLHVLMEITKLLLKLLTRKVNLNTKLKNALKVKFNEINIKLPIKSKNNNKLKFTE